MAARMAGRRPILQDELGPTNTSPPPGFGFDADRALVPDRREKILVKGVRADRDGGTEALPPMAPAPGKPSALLHELARRTVPGLNAAARARQWWTANPEMRTAFPEGPSSMAREVVRFWREERDHLMSKEELTEVRRLKGRTRRCRSDVARARHRDPMLREFLGILRMGSPTMLEEIRDWMARREPLPQPAV